MLFFVNMSMVVGVGVGVRVVLKVMSEVMIDGSNWFGGGGW